MIRPQRVTLVDGPANGEQILVRETWVWVAKKGGELYVFDLDRPDAEQTLSLVGRGGWDEYDQDPLHPDQYRWARKTP